MNRKEIKAQAARYMKFVEWSDEDKCFIGRCPEIMGGGVHGKDEAKVYAELCQTVEEWIELLAGDGKDLPKLFAKTPRRKDATPARHADLPRHSKATAGSR
jgi:predicted RNase H-like HicB family nuclease